MLILIMIGIKIISKIIKVKYYHTWNEDTINYVSKAIMLIL